MRTNKETACLIRALSNALYLLPHMRAGQIIDNALTLHLRRCGASESEVQDVKLFYKDDRTLLKALEEYVDNCIYYLNK